MVGFLKRLTANTNKRVQYICVKDRLSTLRVVVICESILFLLTFACCVRSEVIMNIWKMPVSRKETKSLLQHIDCAILFQVNSYSYQKCLKATTTKYKIFSCEYCMQTESIVCISDIFIFPAKRQPSHLQSSQYLKTFGSPIQNT